MDLFYLADRHTNEVHLVYYNAWYGHKYTYCGKCYSNKNYPQIVALSGPIKGCCEACVAMAAKGFNSTLNHTPRVFRKKNDKKLIGAYYSTKSGLGIERKFIGMNLNWCKLSRYKFKTKRIK